MMQGGSDPVGQRSENLRDRETKRAINDTIMVWKALVIMELG